MTSRTLNKNEIDQATRRHFEYIGLQLSDLDSNCGSKRIAQIPQNYYKKRFQQTFPVVNVKTGSNIHGFHGKRTSSELCLLTLTSLSGSPFLCLESKSFTGWNSKIKLTLRQQPFNGKTNMFGVHLLTSFDDCLGVTLFSVACLLPPAGSALQLICKSNAKT